MIGGAGENGCGFESQLESWYRFLVDAKIYEYPKTGKADGELRALGK